MLSLYKFDETKFLFRAISTDRTWIIKAVIRRGHFGAAGYWSNFIKRMNDVGHVFNCFCGRSVA